MIHFQHFNFNVLNLDKSRTFYKNALDLEVVREYVPVVYALRTAPLNWCTWAMAKPRSSWN